MDPHHTAPSDAAPDDAPASAGASARAERHLAVLDQVMEAALRVSLAIERRCIAAAGLAEADGDTAENSVEGAPEAVAASPRTVAELALAFHRATRAVRMTINLQARLMAEARPSEGGQAPPQTVRVVFVDGATGQTIPRTDVTGGSDVGQPPSPATQIRPASPAAVGAIVGQVARAGLQPGECDPREAAELVERFTREAVERLEDESEFDEVMRRPVSEIVERICRDLGLCPDWPALAEEAWAQAELAGENVGAPLAALKPKARPKPEPKPMRRPDIWPEGARPRPSTGSG